LHLRNPLVFLLGLNKKVIFALDIPSLPFDPKICLDNRPFRLTEIKQEACFYPRSEFESKDKQYRDDVLSVLKDFPQVKVFDPADALYDEQYCWGKKNGKLLYSTYGSNSHLSVDGSKFVEQYLAPLIMDVNGKN